MRLVSVFGKLLKILKPLLVRTSEKANIWHLVCEDSAYSKY